MNRFASFLKNIPGYLSNTKETINETIEQIQQKDNFYMNLRNHSEKKILDLLKSNHEQEVIHGLKFLIAVSHSSNIIHKTNQIYDSSINL